MLDDYNASDGRLYPDNMHFFISTFKQNILSKLSDADISTIHESFATSSPIGHPVSVLRIGYLPRNQSRPFPGASSLVWTSDSCGRLLSVKGHLTPATDIPDKLFYEPHVLHSACIHSDVLDRMATDRWIPVVPVSCGGVSSRANEIITCQSALREYSQVFRRAISQKCCPFEIEVCFLYISKHGVQRPDVVKIIIKDAKGKCVEKEIFNCDHP